MKAFRIVGEIEVKKRRWQKFSKEISADDEAGAREKILSDLGSRHRRKRRSVKIASVSELSADEISDPIIKHRLGVE